jgi:hypothetical protein
VILTRDSSLQVGSAQLVGVTGWTGALVEIVDGPLAGEFAFSDEMGMVIFNGLPLGPVRVRASYGGLEQTLTITVTPRLVVFPALSLDSRPDHPTQPRPDDGNMTRGRDLTLAAA